MLYYLNPLPASNKPGVSGPYTEAMIREMLETKAISNEAIIRGENEEQWRPVSTIVVQKVEEPKISERELEAIYEKITPFLRELHEDAGLRAWYLSMEYIDPAVRATEFEKLARHSEATDPRSELGKMFRLFRDPAIYTAGLRSLRKFQA